VAKTTRGRSERPRRNFAITPDDNVTRTPRSAHHPGSTCHASATDVSEHATMAANGQLPSACHSAIVCATKPSEGSRTTVVPDSRSSASHRPTNVLPVPHAQCNCARGDLRYVSRIAANARTWCGRRCVISMPLTSYLAFAADVDAVRHGSRRTAATSGSTRSPTHPRTGPSTPAHRTAPTPPANPPTRREAPTCPADADGPAGVEAWRPTAHTPRVRSAADAADARVGPCATDRTHTTAGPPPGGKPVKAPNPAAAPAEGPRRAARTSSTARTVAESRSLTPHSSRPPAARRSR
jgi:hypothetical protein